MEGLTERIRENLVGIQERIGNAARGAGRKPEDVRLVVVTKTQPVEVVVAAIQAGARILGENYPEEAEGKIRALRGANPPEWHMIGHLQSRKAPIVAASFDMFESLDRFDLAEKMQKRLAMLGRKLPVLLECNVGGEESKSGWDASERSSWPGLIGEVGKLITLPNLEIKGLMTMPPLMPDPSQARPYFARLREVRDAIQEVYPQLRLTELSMGTSADFEVAIKEGATLVRIGTAILGPRAR